MTVRRHWPWVMSIPMLLAAVGLALLEKGADVRPVRAQVVAGDASGSQKVVVPAAPSINSSSVQVIRAELSLTNADLAALGVSSATAQQLLEAVKAAAATDSNPLGAPLAAERTAVRNLAEAVRKINVGPRDDALLASLPTLKQNVQNAKAQKAAALLGLANQINGMLTADQQVMWQAARANAGRMVPGSYRYVSGLTDDQAQRLDMAARQGGAPGLVRASSGIVSGAQAQQAQVAQENQRLCAARVAVAENQVFPRPTTSAPAPR